DVGRFGLLNCYDIWFPETMRTITAMGAEVVLHPVMTHTIDRDVDLAVAKASAAMFQCYIFDINGLAAGGKAVDVEDVALEHRGRGLGDGKVDVAVDGVRHHRMQHHLGAHGGDGAHRLREPDVVAIEQAEAAHV